MRLDVRCPKCGGVTFAVPEADEPGTFVVMEHIAPNGQWCATAFIDGKANLDVIVGAPPVSKDLLLSPKAWIDALGPFDLDPCASPEPRPWPTAAEHFDSAGLERDWHGFVWVNPIGLDERRWIGKLARHGNGIGVVRVNNIETRWFDYDVWAKADVVLVLMGRPYFCLPDGKPTKRDFPCGVALAGYGPLAVHRLTTAPLDGNCLTEWVRTKEVSE